MTDHLDLRVPKESEGSAVEGAKSEIFNISRTDFCKADKNFFLCIRENAGMTSSLSQEMKSSVSLPEASEEQGQCLQECLRV